MTSRDDLAALGPVADALEALQIEFYVGGSVASSLHGVARATLDIDIVAAIQPGQVDDFAARLGDAYYVEPAQIRSAIASERAFNLIHLETMYKVDVFVMKTRPFDRAARGRTLRQPIAADSDRLFAIASAEDTVLNKLEWFRAGGEVSARQWQDVIGVLRVQRAQLDEAYLRRWADQIGVLDLLERALDEAARD